MTLRTIIAAVLVLCATAAHGQKPPRIAFLAGGSRAGDAVLLAAFWQGMKQQGYVEGKNVLAEYRFAEGAPERLPSLAQELVRLNVAVIIGPGSGALAARKATDTIPIVLTYGDPVALGLVASLARPGGNVTGLSAFASELGEKQLEVLKEAFPKVSRVAVLWWAADAQVDSMKAAAARLGLTLQVRQLREGADVDAVLTRAKAEHTQALLVTRNPFTATNRTQIAGFAARNRMPAIYPDREFIDAGGLMSYGVSVPDLWARAAVYVDKILKGTPPSTIPVERPTRFALVVNMKVAQASGLSVSPSVLTRADEVVR